MASTHLQRPRFSPVQYQTADSVEPPLEAATDSKAWLPLIWCPADFPPEVFELAVSQLIHHPEYNSTLILRSETVAETIEDFPLAIPEFKGLRPLRNIHRRLLPRRPGRDTGLEQHCTLYDDAVSPENERTICTLALTPIVEAGGSLPYYHPTVSHLAFRYISADIPLLRIEAVPLPGTPTDPNSRLYRTCLALLETLHRYGWGAMTNYKKRVIHDAIIPREAYQDMYLIMRERHKHLITTWQESTDPLKHVFEASQERRILGRDIGIATFLMLLWKDMYGGDTQAADQKVHEDLHEPWKNWPRPPSGFLDLGCGNGLLVHILVSEGYEGHGIDLRARTSWSYYPESTQKHLHIEAVDPTAFLSPSESHHQQYFPPGVFIIGNHADELTPWVPVLSTLCSASGYLSIPCCAWTFDARYERSRNSDYDVPDMEKFVQSLNLGGDGGNTSSYSMYRIWLASLSYHCGWKVECENLRIPSTRNWAIIGRKTITQDSVGLADVRERVKSTVENVRERGLFKTRTPEGKAGEH
ncbi:hypothetical protein CERSUDRAFT_147858 [Gelatoporia subvermispora B]|uniref:tRNA (uracil-O(2)-)-methyltransferase n=1 Tax=Ceriporiopsis subvermispora (strain B) TaxID=914234 RepID=M2QYH2_CERS8|nr:hypothetical protein CERSUDRAFT_147858 [Gelatoporia subvermispora B]